jgi:hypothetical protein
MALSIVSGPRRVSKIQKEKFSKAYPIQDLLRNEGLEAEMEVLQI